LDPLSHGKEDRTFLSESNDMREAVFSASYEGRGAK